MTGGGVGGASAKSANMPNTSDHILFVWLGAEGIASPTFPGNIADTTRARAIPITAARHDTALPIGKDARKTLTTRSHGERTSWTRKHAIGF
ncbi:hypothetical protein GCM10022213_00140 [Parerythrobacter jejuensis]